MLIIRYCYILPAQFSTVRECTCWGPDVESGESRLSSEELDLLISLRSFFCRSCKYRQTQKQHFSQNNHITNSPNWRRLSINCQHAIWITK